MIITTMTTATVVLLGRGVSPMKMPQAFWRSAQVVIFSALSMSAAVVVGSRGWLEEILPTR